MYHYSISLRALSTLKLTWKNHPDTKPEITATKISPGKKEKIECMIKVINMLQKCTATLSNLLHLKNRLLLLCKLTWQKSPRNLSKIGHTACGIYYPGSLHLAKHLRRASFEKKNLTSPSWNETADRRKCNRSRRATPPPNKQLDEPLPTSTQQIRRAVSVRYDRRRISLDPTMREEVWGENIRCSHTCCADTSFWTVRSQIQRHLCSFCTSAQFLNSLRAFLQKLLDPLGAVPRSSYQRSM